MRNRRFVAGWAAGLVLGLTACPGTPVVRLALWDDFWKGTQVAGLPIGKDAAATLEKSAASLPKKDVSIHFNISGGQGVGRVRLQRGDRSPKGVVLTWLFDDHKLVAIGWESDIDGDFARGRLGHGEILERGVPEFGRVARINVYDAEWKNPKPTDLFESGAELGSDSVVGWRTVYRVFDEAAFMQRVVAQKVGAALAEARRKAALEQRVAAQEAARDAYVASRAGADEAIIVEMERTRSSPLALTDTTMLRFEARTQALEADAPLTAAGIWYHLRYSPDVNQIDAQVSAIASAGLRRTLLPACGRVMPVVAFPPEARWLRSTFNAGIYGMAHPPTAFRFCRLEEVIADGVSPLVGAALAAGRTPSAVTIGPRTVWDVQRSGADSVTSRTTTHNFTVQETNPEREAAMAPLRALGSQVNALQERLAAVNRDAATAKADRRCDEFTGVSSGRPGATGELEGGGISGYKKVQCPSALIAQGRAERDAAALSTQIAALERQLTAGIEKLPPALRPTTQTATTTTTSTTTTWIAKVRQRVVIATSPPIVLDEVVEAYRTVPNSDSEASVTQALQTFAADDAIGRGLAQKFGAFVEHELARGALPFPAPSPRLSAAAAETERRWTNYFFGNGPSGGLWPEPKTWNW